MRRPTFLALLASLAATLLAPGQAEAQRVLRYTDHEPLGGMRTRFLKDILFPAIEKETQGRIRIEAHWDGEIADSHGVLAAVNSEDASEHRADIGVIVPEYFAQQMPMGQLFKSFLTGPSGAAQVDFFRRAFDEIPAFREELGRNGLTGIFYATGYPVAFYSTAPLAGLGDMAGQKWRTASFWHRDFLKNVGAEPVSIPWGPGVFDAMRERRIDGLMVNVDSGYMLDVHKVAPNVLASKQLWLGHVYIVAINRKTWDGLPDEDRAAIGRAAQAAYARLGAVMDQSFASMLGDLRDAGAKVRLLTPAEVEAFAKATDYQAVQTRWVAEQEAAGVAGMGEVLARLRALAEAFRER